MRIEAQIVGSRDVEVEIDFDEFLEFAFAGKDGDKNYLGKINSIGGLLQRIPDDVIAELTQGQRDIVAKFLRKQADRFAEALAAGGEG